MTAAVRTEDGAIRCEAVVSGAPCAGRMVERGTRLPSDPGRLYCTRCGADRAVPDKSPPAETGR